MSALDAPIAEGLSKAANLQPGHGWADLTAGMRASGPSWAAFARGEVGAALAPGTVAFAFAEAVQAAGVSPEWQAGLGLRMRW